MKKNILVKVGEHTEIRERIVPAIYGDNGELLTEETTETYEVIVPVMQAQTVDMTPEEIAEMERQQTEAPDPEPTLEERLTIMEDAFAELCMEVFGNG